MAADGTAYDLGIDLGTTYVAAGILEQGRPEMITLGDRAPVLPSVLYFRDNGEVLTGEAASRRGLSDPTRVVREFKRRVGDTTPIVVGQTPYSVDVLMAKLLRVVHDAVVERQGAEPQSIVVTHPANWGPYKIDVLEQAVRLADIGDATTLTEPVAAAIHYAAAERLEPGQTVAVYDLGGGTFDAAVLRKTDDAFTVLGEVEGIERLGGIDFDEAVFQHVVRFCESSLAELDMDDPAAIQALARLRQECSEAKEVLSTDTDVTIPVVLPNLQSEVRLTRAEFEAMIRPLLQQTVEALRRAIRSAGVDPQDLAAVLLVGGSSRIPLIAEMVGAELGRPIAVDRHPKHTVALGAAISAGQSHEAPAPQVDDWFRTDPTTTSVPAQAGGEEGSATAAAAVGGVAAAGVSAAAAGLAAGDGPGTGTGDDPLSMFPLKGGHEAGGTAARPSDAPAATPAAAAAAAADRNGSSGEGTTPTIAAPSAQAEAAAADADAAVAHSPAERIGTSPIRFVADEAPIPEAPPAKASPTEAPPPVQTPTTASPAAGSDANAAVAVVGTPSHRPGTAAATASLLGQHATEAPPSFDQHQLRAPGKGSPHGGRLLAMAAVAVIAVLALGGGAWALTRTGSTPDDAATELTDGEEAIGQQGGTENGDGDQGLTASTDRTGSTIEGAGNGGGDDGNDGRTDTTRSTTEDTNDHDTTTTTKDDTTTSTTAETATKIRIVSGPRVNTRNDRSFQFDYRTNDVCGTGSFTVTEKATGRSVGSFRGEDTCYGPRHGGFPGHSSFPGFNLKPGTTYKVSVSVRGTASDGTRTAGSGTATSTFEVTTTGSAVTTTTTTTEPPTDTTEDTTDTTVPPDDTTPTTDEAAADPGAGDAAPVTPPGDEAAAPAGPGPTTGG